MYIQRVVGNAVLPPNKNNAFGSLVADFIVLLSIALKFYNEHFYKTKTSFLKIGGEEY